jgi:hypothetical protein
MKDQVIIFFAGQPPTQLSRQTTHGTTATVCQHDNEVPSKAS